MLAEDAREGLSVTLENHRQCLAARDALRLNIDQLDEMTKKYPVDCTFGGYRIVFRTRADVELLIEVLGEKLAAYTGPPSVVIA